MGKLKVSNWIVGIGSSLIATLIVIFFPNIIRIFSGDSIHGMYYSQKSNVGNICSNILTIENYSSTELLVSNLTIESKNTVSIYSAELFSGNSNNKEIIKLTTDSTYKTFTLRCPQYLETSSNIKIILVSDGNNEIINNEGWLEIMYPTTEIQKGKPLYKQAIVISKSDYQLQNSKGMNKYLLYGFIFLFVITGLVILFIMKRKKTGANKV